MKNTRILLSILAFMSLIGFTSGYTAVTVNVDFNVTSGFSGTYSGTAVAPDFGTVWNGLAIGTQLSAQTSYSSPSLVNSLGLATSVQVQLTNFRPYDSGGSPTPAPAFLADIAAGAAADTVSTPSPLGFTISGLTPGGFYDLYLYSQNGTANNAGTKFTIGTSQTVLNNGGSTFVNGVNYVKFTGVQAGGGAISGTAQTTIANAASFNGFQIVSAGAPALSLVYGNSFEAAQGYNTNFTGAAAGPGLNNNGGVVSVVANPGYNGQATDGTQFLGFNGGVAAPSGGYFLTNGIDTVNGATYYLSFDFGNWGFGNDQTISVTVSDAVTSVVLANTSITDPTSTTAANTSMSPYSISFTGTGHPIFLLFQDTTSAVSTSSSLSDGVFDNIRLFVDLDTIPIPEPSTALLLVSGGWLFWRRGRKT